MKTELTEEEIIILKRLIKCNGLHFNKEDKLETKRSADLSNSKKAYDSKSWLQKLFTPFWNNPYKIGC